MSNRSEKHFRVLKECLAWDQDAPTASRWFSSDRSSNLVNLVRGDRQTNPKNHPCIRGQIRV
ncbi:MAG: hypothetical protein F6K40_24645 [Okeania sp. SIO3I5]|uniref:hypothetical protein n=1 Tax=Okeania sp. SIO3I5 TaxID=2607805 RepID=UPI0013BC2B6A|nr:hypothetical protein [Okeania sp. SIO3I5]NEQ39266.1 hypothetical protein [Okeania sp. SIO3I5]